MGARRSVRLIRFRRLTVRHERREDERREVLHRASLTPACSLLCWQALKR
jgi:hypothetical protein